MTESCSAMQNVLRVIDNKSLALLNFQEEAWRSELFLFKNVYEILVNNLSKTTI